MQIAMARASTAETFCKRLRHEMRTHINQTASDQIRILHVIAKSQKPLTFQARRCPAF